MPSDHDIWSYMHIHILDKYLAGCSFPGIFTSLHALLYFIALLLPGLWLLKVKLPHYLGGAVDLFTPGVAQCPRTHMGVMWLSFLCLSLAGRRQFSSEG